LTLSVKISNPNARSMTIRNIKYDLMLTETNQLLMSGALGEINLPAHATTEVLVKSSVHFAPTINLAYMTIFEKSVMMEIKAVGTAPGIFSDQSFSFSRSFDAYPWISDKLGSLASSAL
jgi:LEA14-like dessication related protein